MCKLKAVQTPLLKAWWKELFNQIRPGRETGGAQAMVDDGLYDRVLLPDLTLAQHVMPSRAGTLAIRSCPILVAAGFLCGRVTSALRWQPEPANLPKLDFGGLFDLGDKIRSVGKKALERQS